MSATNRVQLTNKLFKVARKHYTPISPLSSRGVIDHMLYACCLENSLDETADESFAKLEGQYFDWNEVRVTTTAELMETMKNLYHPEAAAASLKKVLHGVFEAFYEFDLDFLRKENLRKTIQKFESFRGVSPFVVAYTVQNALGGHSIPLDDAMISLLVVLGIANEQEAANRKIVGLERTIPKSKGVEFFSVVHQLATAFYKAPHSPDLRKIVTSIAPDAKDRFPKRGGRRKVEAPEPSQPATSGKLSMTTDKSGKTVKPVLSKTTKKKATSVPRKAANKKSTKPPLKSQSVSHSTGKKPQQARKKSTARSLSRKKPR